MTNNLLSVALGRFLSQFNGLREVDLPSRLPLEDALAIANAANQERPGPVPYAIVISDALGRDIHDLAGVVSANDAIAYREGNRLAIRSNSTTQSASSASSFVQIINQSFPAEDSYSFDFGDLVRFMMRLVLAEGGVEAQEQSISQTDFDRLSSVLMILRDTYEAFGQTRVSWNNLWFEHVNRGLATLVEALKLANDSTSLTDFFAVNTYAAFSLPVPTEGICYSRNNNTGRAIREALTAYWSSEETILASLALLGAREEVSGAGHALTSLDWTLFDQIETSENSVLKSWSLVSAHMPDRTTAFSMLEEAQFFSPVETEFADSVLRLEDEAGASLFIPLTNTFILETTHSIEENMSLLRTQKVRILIPCVLKPSTGDVKKSKIEIVCSGRKMSFKGEFFLKDTGLFAEGFFEEKLRQGDFKFKVSQSKLTVDLPKHDPLVGNVLPGSTASGYFLPPAGCGLIAFPKTGVTYGKPAIASVTEFNGEGCPKDDQVDFECRLAKPRENLLICWGPPACEAPVLHARKIQRRSWATHLSVEVFEMIATLGDGDVLEIGEVRIVFVIEAKDSSPETTCASPIVAAIEKKLPSGKLPDVAVRESIRGEAEEVLVELIASEQWKSSLGHIVMPQDKRTGIYPLVDVERASILIPDSFEAQWSDNSNFSVPAELTQSDEAKNFRHAFDKLEIPKALTYSLAGSDETSTRWVSLTSWKHLWETPDNLERYLRAYAELVMLAQNLKSPSAAAVFWATFPFSISSWDNSNLPIRCESVLLSPLHPIRLTWLAATEATLYGASNAASLAATIEGWNFPYLSVSESAGGRMIAMPSDAGADQLFLGWSMMVSAPIGRAAPIKAPEFIGRFRSPGTSSGGLNGASVAGAIKEYRRMNAHASTVTIDLAASSPANRALDIDEAVISAMKQWFGGDSRGGAGGFRVEDSLNRLGEAPREQLVKLLGNDLSTPLTWSRYKPKPGASEKSNIRLLQDSGVALNIVSDAGVKNAGVLGRVPLRRFEARDPRVIDGTGRSAPGISPDSGWQPFSAALSLIEGGESGTSIHTQIVGAAIADAKADWTISGETLVSPASLAALMKAGKGENQMLWEWRPPFLERGSSTLSKLDRRPYFSVVRVPASFRQRVEEKLESALQRQVSAEDTDLLLRTLGTRGVGLASLVSMGGTHATGALGFYAALELMNRSEKSSVNRFVMPLDACDEFLWTLADDQIERMSKHRADLLLIEVTDERVTLLPLEIKYWGLAVEGNAGSFPKMNDLKVKEALEQASLTHRLLGGLKDKSMEFTSETPDRQLWYSAFGALIESALKLHPEPPRDQAALISRLESLINGDMSLNVAPPLLLILQQGARTEDGESHRLFYSSDEYGPQDESRYGALIADPTRLFQTMNDKDSAINRSWNELLDWAFTSELEDAGEASGLKPSHQGKASGSSDLPNDTEELETVPEIDPNNGSKVAVGFETDVPDSSGGSEMEKENESPEISGDGVRFAVGDFLDSVREAKADFWPGNTALNQMNVGIVGDLGTGKTQLLMSVIAKLRSESAKTQVKPLSMLIFDYKQDFQREDFLAVVGGRVIKPFGIPLNIFKLPEKTQQAAYQRARSFVDVLTRIYGGLGQVQINKLTEVIMDLYKAQDFAPPTLNMVLAKYREKTAHGDAVVGLLNHFVMGRIFSETPESLVSFDELIGDGVVVLALNELGVDQKTKNALVVLFLNQYYEYMLRQKKEFFGTDPQLRKLNSFLVVDEAHNIIEYEFRVLQLLLLEGREFGVGVVLSSQYLSHFKTPSYNYGQVLRSWIIHKVPNVTAQQLVQLGLPDAKPQDAARIQVLQNHQAYFSSLGIPGRFIRGEPFFEFYKESKPFD